MIVVCSTSRLGTLSRHQPLSDAAPLPTTEPMPRSHTPRWAGVLMGGVTAGRGFWMQTPQGPGRGGTKALTGVAGLW